MHAESGDNYSMKKLKQIEEDDQRM